MATSSRASPVLFALLCVALYFPAATIGTPAAVGYDIIMILLEAVATKAIDLAVDSHASKEEKENLQRAIDDVNLKIIGLQKQQSASAQEIADLKRQTNAIEEVSKEKPFHASSAVAMIKVGRVTQRYPAERYIVFETDFPVSMAEQFLIDTPRGRAYLQIEKRYRNQLSASVDNEVLQHTPLETPVYVARPPK